jgi:hypothetical protein
VSIIRIRPGKIIKSGMGKKRRVKSNPHSKIDPIMPGHKGKNQ